MAKPAYRFHLAPLWAPLLLLPLGCGQSPAAADDEEDHPAPVKAVQAQAEVLGQWTELLGTTQPLPGKVARLSAPVSGRVLALGPGPKGSPLTEGQQVARDQVLIRLDDRIARAARDKAQAVVSELAEQAKQAEFPVMLAQLELAALEKLKSGDMPGGSLQAISRLDLEKARIAVKDAQSRQRLAQDKLKTAQTDLTMLEAELDLYTVRAPLGGRLGLIQIAPGQTLSVGTPVADILDLGEIDILCFAPPHLVSRLALGQPVRLAAEAGPSPVPAATGKVCYLAVQAEPDSGSFVVKARFPNPDLRLRAGQVKRVEVLTQEPAQRLVVPEQVLMEDQDPPRVVAVEDLKAREGKEGKAGKARRLQAKVGVRQRGRWVELVELTDPKTGKAVPVRGSWFVSAGGHGLADDDPVLVEDEHHEEPAEGKQP
jgi:RND family efflux transporter MFP subunit